MTISHIRIEEKSFPLKVPFITSLRRVDCIEAIHLILETDDGIHAVGAAAPLKAITGEDRESIIKGIHRLYGNFLNRPLNSAEEELDLLQELTEIGPGPKGAMDMALHDLYSRAEGLPLYTYLGGKSGSIISDLTISLNNADQMVLDSRKAEAEGFQTLKIKLGGSLEDDLNRFRKISHAVGCNLRIDANQGWSIEESLAFMDRCEKEKLSIDLLEQPLIAEDLKGMAYIRKRINCPLAADESVFTLDDAKRIIDCEGADIINVKLLKCGGISQAKRILNLAESEGLECMMGCMMESPIGISAALHLTAASPVISYYDLDVPYLLNEIPQNYGFRNQGIKLSVTETAGLYD